MSRIRVKILVWVFVLSCLFLLGFSAALAARGTIPVVGRFHTQLRIAAADSRSYAAPDAIPLFARFQNREAHVQNLSPQLMAVNLPLTPQRFALSAAAAAATGEVILDGTNYPRTDAGFAAALAAAGQNGTVLLPQGAIITLTSEHVVSTNGTIIDCAPGAGFVSGVDGVSLITITGNSDQVIGCHFWGGSSPSSNPLFLWNSTGARIERNSALAFVGVSTSFVYLVGARASAIKANQCVAGRGGASCIFGEKNTIATIVQSNDLDESLGAASSHAIAFHSTDPGQTVNGSKILGNQIVAGAGFCVEVGAFGGETAQGVVISSNTCNMSTDGLGGYSVGSAAKFWTVSNNTFDSNGFEPGISCIEVAGASDGTVTGNSCDGGNISLSNSQAQRVTVSSNLIYDLRGECAGIYLGTSIASGAVNDNLIIGNLIRLPAGRAAVGIWQQCNATGATCNNNSYSYNTVVSDGSVGTVGLKIENDYGTSKNENVGPNTFRDPVTSLEPLGWISYTVPQAGFTFAPTPPPVTNQNNYPTAPVNPISRLRR